MTSDLRAQVREYTEIFVSTVETIDLDAITERPIGIGEGPVRPLGPLPSSNRHRGWLVGVAAAGAVLVLIGGVALLLRAATTETPAATTPPIVSSPSLTWSRVPYDEAAFGGARGQMMKSVTVGGPGFVAVGSVENDGDADAAVWTSGDGITWSRVPHDEAVFGGAQGQWINSVTAGGPGLVAVGSDGRFSHGYEDALAYGWYWWGDQDGAAAVWTSIDGVTW